MHSRTTATVSSNRTRARLVLPPLLSLVILAGAMAVGPGVPADARGVREPDSGAEENPPEAAEPVDTAAFTDAHVDTPCLCSGRDATTAVPFSVLASGANAAQQGRLAATATSQGELEELWSRVARTRVPKPDPPDVRFDSQTAVAIFMGQQPSGGYSIEVDASCRSDEGGTVHLCYTAYEPAEDAIVTMALTSPYAFVIIDEPWVDVIVHRRSAIR
jgi:hypothetical protein